MAFSSLPEWLAWLEQNHPREIDLGLERVSEVARRMGLPGGSPTLTVAGTNGKGSCVATATTLLCNAGRKVGTYTSPHLLRYNERICINGVPVEDDLICEAFTAINRAQGDISLSYFEFGTLAALYVFRAAAVEVSVLEVGLGGRLDAVNLVDADVAVVTSIAIDHESWLGSDRETIGREKAGIFRAGRVALCVDPAPPHSVAETAKNLGADWQPLGSSFDYGLSDNAWWWRSGDEVFEGLAPVSLPLPSVAVAIRAVQLLGVNISQALLDQTLPQLQLAGRMQRLDYRGRKLILDVAHNPAATAYLADALARRREGGRLFGIVAMMADKDRAGSLAPLVDLVDVWCLAALPGNPRAATPVQLTVDLAQCGQTPQLTGSIQACLDWCVEHSVAEDTLVVLGSFFTVSAALAIVAGNSSSKTERGGV